MIRLRMTKNAIYDMYNMKLNFIGYIMGEEWLEEARRFFFDGYKDPYLALPSMFGEYINRTIRPNSKDIKSIQAYAVFLEKTETEVKDLFEANGQ